ncbi:hypothetical protein ACTFIY_010528 [Dictyostelium cf. discoideum]
MIQSDALKNLKFQPLPQSSAQQPPNKQKQVNPNQYISMGDLKQLENLTNIDKEKAVLGDADDQEMEQDDGDERHNQVLLVIDDIESMSAYHSGFTLEAMTMISKLFKSSI